MDRFKAVLAIVVILAATTAWAQDERVPRVGYLYPAGGQRGETFGITVGGQYLRGSTKVYVSGEGVSAEVVKYYRPVRNLQKDQRDYIQAQLKELRAKYTTDRPGAVRRPNAARPGANRPTDKRPQAAASKTTDAKGGADKKKEEVRKPLRPVEHPLLDDMDDKSLAELDHLAYYIFFPRVKKQQNAQIDELLRVKVTIDPEAAPGDRELRIQTPTGLTNPVVFQVGLMPEVCELEPNDPKPWVNPNLPKPKVFDTPVLLNGQIMPGDVDRFRLRARQGQQLVMEVNARRLIPYLADAVPGWFQATLALYDPKGNEVAFADDYRFNPDPVLFYNIPEDGVYELEIRDSIYRGREDFVYRIAVGETPFITQMFPLGGPEGVETTAMIDGWNVAKKQITLDTKPGGPGIRQATLHEKDYVSNEVTYAVDSMPEGVEREPNNTIAEAQKVDLPKIVNGRIAEPGDVDVFEFDGHAGDEVVGEVFGRLLKSPLDSLLRLTDASGKVLEWNDDYETRDGHLRTGAGLLTHHADSYLMARLTEDCVYFIHLADAQNAGGDAYAYRLRLTPAKPYFELRMDPSSVNFPAGGFAPVTVHALRKGGFTGPIQIALKDTSSGFAVHGGTIPRGQDHVRMTLKAPYKPIGQPISLSLEGSATVGSNTIRRPVVPADDVMQAFLWRHLVPSQDLVAFITKARARTPIVGLASSGPIKVPKGGIAQVTVKTPKPPAQKNFDLKLREAPEGLTIQDVHIVKDGLAFQLKADEEKAETGLSSNLIVEAFGTTSWKDKQTQQQRTRRVSFGVLPAIPFEVVQR